MAKRDILMGWFALVDEVLNHCSACGAELADKDCLNPDCPKVKHD